MSETEGVVPLDAVVTTADLTTRPSRAPAFERETAVLLQLAQQMANAPGAILQRLVDTALSQCNAHSAGISLLETDSAAGAEVFRWHAVAGDFAPRVWATMPRKFSPCGTVLDRNDAQLMTHPERHFTPLRGISPRVVEALLVPFHIRGEAVGTIWVLSHDPARRFDAEDLRILSTLAAFCAAAYQMLMTHATNRQPWAGRRG
jgi:GAF domain-containing protein